MELLKKIFSYVVDIPIEQRASSFSGQVEVTLRQGQYMLSTRNAIYSFGKKYTSFDTAFKKINIAAHPISSVLVLGLGLGSVIDLLEKHVDIQHIVAIDTDDVIIELAQKYLQSNLKNKVHFICADAAEFVNKNQEKFDAVLFDVFIDDKTPVHFMQPDFLEQLKKSVRKNGVLIYSKIEDSIHSKIENRQFESKFLTVFPESFSVDANGNKMYVWYGKD